MKFPVEIQTRVPKLFLNLDKFYNQLSTIWSAQEEYDFFIDLKILNLKRKIEFAHLDHAFLLIKSQFEALDLKKIKNEGTIINLHHTTEFIEFKYTVISKKSLKQHHTTVDINPSIGHIYTNIKKSILGSDINGFIVGGTVIFKILYENDVTKFLSDFMIDRCFKKENIPSGQAGIIIYSHLFNSEYFLPFFKSVVSRYIASKSNKVVIGVTGVFNENESTLIIPFIQSGEQVRDLIKKYFMYPDKVVVKRISHLPITIAL